MRKVALLVTVALALCTPLCVEAQQLAQRFTESDGAPVPFPARGDWTALRAAKWGTLAAAAGIGAYGFVVNDRAEVRYQRLEAICQAERDRCAARLESGAFADPELERAYQDVLALDRNARIALLASQVGVAASVVMFILDLRETTTPPNVPYEPDELRVVPRYDGALEVGVRLRH